MESLVKQIELLRRLTKSDPDPRVRHRADALLLVAGGMPIIQTARFLETSPSRIRAWRTRFLNQGRAGLADQPRTGRPPKLDAEACALLVEAIEAGPAAYGLPVTVWSVRDLRELLSQHGVHVCSATVHRTLHRLGYRYRRPRHDLRHRQDADAVAATIRVLDWLKKGGVDAGDQSGSCTSTSVRSIPIHGWQRSGNAVASPPGSRPPG
jgi:putative transposase